MTFYLWDMMYQILGISLIVLISIFVYKIFIATRSDRSGIPRAG